MREVVITSAVRTPVGTLNGSLSSLSGHALGTVVIGELLKRSNIQASEVNEVMMGQVLTAGTGQNPARQAALNAGLPDEVTAITINQVCGSGLRSVALAYQAVKQGDAEIVIAGGQESMSHAPHVVHMRKPHKMGHAEMLDTMLKDGLIDAFHGYHMGITAENIATKWQITRQQQDILSLDSQQKAGIAIQAAKFNEEIVPVVIKERRKERTFDTDEHPRPNITLADLSKLVPVFSEQGSVTAGNASGINDGAAAVLVMSLECAQKHNLKPLARIASWAAAGVSPEVMGTGPIPASRKALKKVGWNLQDLDVIEVNEAFAAQVIAVNQEMGWDTSKVNCNGGAIALGHPIGASGTRILCTLLYEMQRKKAKKCLATLCIGGGMGITLCLEGDVS